MNKLKKYIAAFMILTMLMSVFVQIPVFAAEDYSDYTAPEERTDNLIAKNTNLNLYKAINTEVVKVDAGATSSEVNYTYIGDGSGGNKWSNFSFYGTEGTWAKSTDSGAGGTSGFNGYYPEGPESFVVEMKLRNAAPEVATDPEFTFSVFTARTEGITDKQIVPVTATDGWQTVKTIFHTDAASPTSMWIALGYGGATSSVYPAIGTSIALYKPSLYVAVEKAHDITVTGSANVASGESTELKAQVVNQIGLTGSLTQDFTWIALNADRSAEVDGFTFTEGTDGAVTVNVAEGVPTGKYVMLARSNVYSGFQKGVAITVLGSDSLNDYIPGDKPMNMVPNPDSSDNFTYINSYNADISMHDGTYFSWTEKAVGADASWGAVPTYLAKSYGERLTSTFTSGTKYVVSARLKNDTTLTRPDMQFAVGYINVLLGTADVKNSEYETKTIYFTAPRDMNGLAIGLLGKEDRTSLTDLGTVTMDLSGGGSMYIAEEIAYDITLESEDAPDIFEGGESFKLDAAIVNQLGQKGTIAQTDFEWYALNADKTKIASDLSLNLSEDGTSAQVTLADDIKEGTYCIVARSTTYDNMIKTYRIPVGVVEESAPDNEYSINTEVDSSVLLHGEAMHAKASVADDSGIFTWQVLDSSCAPYNGDFELEISEDTCEATFVAGDKLPAGTYYLAVCETGYDITKLINFRVVNDGISYYVSPEGNDYGTGTISSPFATIERARQAVSQIKNKDDYKFIEVVLRGGDYRFAQTLDFDSGDSGTAVTPVTYRAYEGETPVIKGSVMLDTSKFREAMSADVVSRLHPDADGKVFVTSLTEQGLGDEDVFDMSQSIATLYSLAEGYELNSLFADGREQTLSQWPNERTYATRGDAIVDETYVDENGKNVNVSTSFYYTDAEPDRWIDAKNWYIGAFIPYDYSYARLTVESVDNQNKILKVHAPSNRKSFNFTNNFSKRWKAFNLLEEIDVPGEYCIDSENKLLYYYPGIALDDSALEIAVMFDDLISVDGASNITFSGITFTQTNGVAIKMTDVDNVDVADCTFDSIGGRAIYIRGSGKAQTDKDHWQRQMTDGSYNIDITGCTFFNLANTAINMTGGNVDTLTPSNNVIENNLISGFSLKTLSSSDGAIALGGCGITVRGNNISCSPGKAIQIMGNDHVIEYNEIYDVMREVQDAGAIYQGQNALARGTVIRYNYLHDMRPTDAITDDSAQVAIYLDDCQQDLTIENNIIKNVKIDFNSNGAGAFTFSGNTSVDVDKSWNLLNHNLTSGYTVTESFEGSLDWIKAQLFDTELYYERYPELEEFLENGKNPKRFTVVNDNITVNTGKTNIELQDILYASRSGNDEVTDNTYSLFVDPHNQDYRIKSGSGYAKDTRLTQSFDIDKIGLGREFILSEYSSPFGQIYPKAASKVAYKDSGVKFIWEPALGANEYKLIIASDANMQTVVHEETVRVNYCTVDTLESGKTYYWAVVAANTSREIPAQWYSTDAACSFTLADFEHALSLTDATMDISEASICVGATVTNNMVSDNTDFTVYFAAYSGEKLCGVQDYAVSVSLGQSVNVKHDFELEGADAVNCVKIFVWAKDSVIPVREARILK